MERQTLKKLLVTMLLPITIVIADNVITLTGGSVERNQDFAYFGTCPFVVTMGLLFYPINRLQ